MQVYVKAQSQHGHSIVAKMYHVLRTCLGSWPAVLQVDLKRSQMGPQYDICRDLSRTGPLFSTVFFQMGKVPYSHFRSPVRSDTAQSRVWEPCAHRARTPVGTLEAPRGTRRPPKAHCRKSSGIYPGVTWCPLAAIRGRAAKRQRIARGSSVVWGSCGATLYLMDRERCSEAYVLHCALTPPGGERPGGKRPYGPDTPI